MAHSMSMPTVRVLSRNFLLFWGGGGGGPQERAEPEIEVFVNAFQRPFTLSLWPTNVYFNTGRTVLCFVHRQNHGIEVKQELQ